MKLMGRRAALRALGIGAASAPLAASSVVRGAAALEGGAMPASLFSGTPMPSYGAPSATGILSTARRLAQKMFEAENQRYYERFSFRIAGFDPDIYALHSLPLATKIRMQRTRDKEPKTILERLRKQAWPED